ncbi:MAG: MerR family transcriptional regulator [Clostridia bacterium]|nr:MerR family transcriptional regulator [Clostridia bacterium]
MEKVYSIGEVIKKLNINKETIRYYEKIGLLSQPQKASNGYRVYSEEDINIIWFIQITKKFGFTLKEIKTLITTIYNEIIGGDARHIISIVNNKINEIENKVSELEKTKKLLQKVNYSIISQKKECFGDLESFFEGRFEDNT